MAVIDVQGITKRYPRRALRAVLEDVSLRVAEGSVLGLLGPNGAGKTTLIKVIAGLLVPDSGGGTVLGYDLLRESARIRAAVSLVAPTADVGLDNNLTVRQNLQFWAPVYGLRGRQARDRIASLLERLGLFAKADVWPMHLSAGQRQRLALARSLLAQTRLVFLDEPTAKLDAQGVRSVRDLIGECNRQAGVTVVLTTHVMEEAEELCTDIALLRDGRLRAHLPADALRTSLGLEQLIQVRISPAAGTDGLWGKQATPGRLARMLRSEFGALPEVSGVAWDPDPGPCASGMLTLRSRDPARSTPALLDALVGRGLAIRSMETKRVTLDVVFRRLMAEPGVGGPDAPAGAEVEKGPPASRGGPKGEGP